MGSDSVSARDIIFPTVFEAWFLKYCNKHVSTEGCKLSEMLQLNPLSNLNSNSNLAPLRLVDRYVFLETLDTSWIRTFLLDQLEYYSHMHVRYFPGGRECLKK